MKPVRCQAPHKRTTISKAELFCYACQSSLHLQLLKDNYNIELQSPYSSNNFLGFEVSIG